jgi:hypothetical protein
MPSASARTPRPLSWTPHLRWNRRRGACWPCRCAFVGRKRKRETGVSGVSLASGPRDPYAMRKQSSGVWLRSPREAGPDDRAGAGATDPGLFGIIACLAIIPFVLVFGPLRGIPWFWQCIDTFVWPLWTRAAVGRASGDPTVAGLEDSNTRANERGLVEKGFLQKMQAVSASRRRANVLCALWFSLRAPGTPIALPSPAGLRPLLNPAASVASPGPASPKEGT